MTAALESVTVLPEIEATVVPAGIPPPETAWPTERTEPSDTVTEVVAFKVPETTLMPPETCNVPLPSLVRLPVPPLIGLFRKRVPVPFCWTMTSEAEIPICPPSRVTLLAPTFWMAPLVSVSTLPTAPMFTT